MLSRFWNRVRKWLFPRDGGPQGPPEDWSQWGQLGRIAASEPPAGYESPGRLVEEADALGRAQGVVRAEDGTALAEDNGAYEYVEGAVGVRKGVLGGAAWKRVGPAYGAARAAPSRAQGEVDRAAHIRERLTQLETKILPAVIRQHGSAKEELGKARAGLMKLPQLLRGYFTTYRPVALAGGSVVCFDAFVLHGALVTSGLDVVSIWGTTATVAMAVAAANHAFGVLAGAIGLATPPRHRMRVAAVLFVAGFGAMLVAFLLLMVFRAEATSATNEALESIARGRTPDHVGFFISPLWMGPLQVGGSLAAITLTAFWTMAKEGREYTALKIVPAEVSLEAAGGRVATVRSRIALLEEALETAVVAKHDVEAEGAAASAEVTTGLMAANTAAAGEDQLGRAAKGRYKASYAYYSKLYRNAGLFRMATKSVRRWFSRRWRSRGEADLPSIPGVVAHPDPMFSMGTVDHGSKAAGASANGHDPAHASGEEGR